MSAFADFKTDVTATYLTLLNNVERKVTLRTIYQKPNSLLVEEMSWQREDVPTANVALRKQVKDIMDRARKIHGAILPGALVDEWEALQPALKTEKEARDITANFHKHIDLRLPTLVGAFSRFAEGLLEQPQEHQVIQELANGPRDVSVNSKHTELAIPAAAGSFSLFAEIPFEETRKFLDYWVAHAMNDMPLRIVDCFSRPSVSDINNRKFHKIKVGADFVYNN
jgi:hypothetical protein